MIALCDNFHLNDQMQQNQIDQINVQTHKIRFMLKKNVCHDKICSNRNENEFMFFEMNDLTNH